MKTLRTPDERFAGLPDFPFEPHYAEVDDGEGGHLRMHYLDEGPEDAAPVLLVHPEDGRQTRIPRGLMAVTTDDGRTGHAWVEYNQAPVG